VVAARDGTDKIIQARKVSGCIIVKTSWLMECVWTITRRDTEPHLLGPASSSKAPLAVAHAPVASSSSDDNDDDDDDDDFAAEFEAELME
jgi:RNA polymerase II subunit A-like phosphatase